jgi:hypothetical protein
MKKKKIDIYKQFGIKIDKSLDRYNDIPMFQEQLDKANETLRRVGLPKELKQQINKGNNLQ